MSTFIVCIILIAIVAFSIRTMINNKKKGKTSCGCGCSSCGLAGMCHGSSKDE